MPLIVQNTKKNSTPFDLTKIKSQMQIATKSKTALEDTKVAIVNMYQNGTTLKLFLKVQNTTQTLAYYIYENRARKTFDFALSKDYHLLPLTISNNLAKPQVGDSLQKGEFGILFWIYQHRLSAQKVLLGTTQVPSSIIAVNF